MANVKKNSAVSSEEEIAREETTPIENDTEVKNLKKENKMLKDQLQE